jgi:hypothetical protein
MNALRLMFAGIPVALIAVVACGGAPSDPPTSTDDQAIQANCFDDPLWCAMGNCILHGHPIHKNTCTETQQCDNGKLVDRFTDRTACTVVIPTGSCWYGSEAYNDGYAPPNACTATKQCDNAHWVARSSDPSACVE